MNFLLIFIIFLLAVALVILAVFVLARNETKKEGTTTAEKLAGVCSYVLDQTVRKNENKAKVLKLLADKSELTNADIREALGISAASAVRYMDELEKEGRVEQVGDTGRGVTYRLKNTSTG